MSGPMRQVFRSKLALILGWVWMAFAAANAVDLVVRYSGPSSLVAGAVLGALTALVFVTCLRPAVVLTEDGVLVRNPLRNVFVPWTGIDDVTVSHAITISSGDRVVRCWTPQTTARERASATRRGEPAAPGRGRFATEPARTKGEQAAAEALAGRTHADWVAEQITERAGAARQAGAAEPGSTEARAAEAGTVSGGMQVGWALSALAALGVALVLVAAAVVVS
ncbi:PH domain-containing protein [Planomonospora sp. ID67723]|uniref:PH domain-containing protein n=1 Tax=Planomonospora sp. ID67723 TaxID=2738134 RepID=UPI0018C353EB|nr:PH domain-containing protein [Planomonospora sp. ID67723]MBG0827941.1 PH domain-containing protein [Planomonospora sp. ID67723]